MTPIRWSSYKCIISCLKSKWSMKSLRIGIMTPCKISRFLNLLIICKIYKIFWISIDKTIVIANLWYHNNKSNSFNQKLTGWQINKWKWSLNRKINSSLHLHNNINLLSLISSNSQCMIRWGWIIKWINSCKAIILFKCLFRIK